MYVRRKLLYYKTYPFGLISRSHSVRYAYIFLRSAEKLSPKSLRFICTLIFLTHLYSEFCPRYSQARLKLRSHKLVSGTLL